MIVSIRGKIEGGGIVLTAPVPLPDGTEVIVQMEPVEPVMKPEPVSEPPGDLASEPAIGMWADREDMKDSAAWVRREREKWRQRLTRSD